MNRMSPMEIVILIQIHCFVYVDQLTMLNDSPAATKAIKRMLRENLICIEDEPDNTRAHRRVRHPYNTTPRGRAHMEKLCNTPFPVLVETWT